ncbi:MAG: transporter ATP-binding protein [Polaromonas sp.]|nr:transporter ATP-binding protein [Polaromonas sp.]
MSAPLLTARGLTRRFGGLVAVNNVDLDVMPGEILGLIGSNGAGKTTLFNLLCGSMPPTSGEVLFEGQNCTGWPAHQMARLGALRTFQITSVFPEETVANNIRIASFRTRKSGWLDSLLYSARFRRDEADLNGRVDQILGFVGLAGRREHLARILPYGEQRKLEVAIAMAGQPRLLMLDEPAAGMNPDEGARLVDMIRRIRDSGVTVVLVEHHMRVVASVCDRIAVLDHGVKIAQGTPTQVLNDPEVIRIYLGREKVSA